MNSPAYRLLEAARTRIPIEPFTGLTVADAYAIQLAQVHARVGDGARITGHKIGLTSAAMQRQLGVGQPDFGHLLDDMELTTNRVRADAFLAPKAEPEIAFVLGAPLSGPGPSSRDVAAAVSHVLPAIEIIDSRIADWRIGLTDTIADNASSGAYLLGRRAIPLGGMDLASIGCVLRAGAEVVATGTGAAVLGDPLRAVAWLANVLAEYGAGLEAGHIVLSGSLTAAVELRPGTEISAEFTRLGHISLYVEEKN